MTPSWFVTLQKELKFLKPDNCLVIRLVLFILCVGSFHHALAENNGPDKATLQRRYDAVIIKGEDLGPVQGASISSIRVFSYSGKGFQAIPFQVDERKPGGDYVLPSGPGATADIDGGRLDYNDELVIMARDAGNRAENDPAISFHTVSANKPDKWVEIELLDPLDMTRKAWIYVCCFRKNPPALSPIDYVRYNIKTEQIFTDRYGLGYDNGMVLYTDLFYPDGNGGYGPDLLDRVKVRITVKFFLNIIRVKRNEGDFREEVVSWKDGPVRVLRNVRNYVRILLNLSSPSVFAVSEYYSDYMFTPLQITVPNNLKRIFSRFGISDFSWYFYGDLPGLEGGTLYTNKYPEGIPISVEEATEWYKEDRDTRNLVWGCAIKKDVGVWFCNIVIPDILYQFTHLYLNLDKSGKYPPEDVPGEVAGGAYMSWKDFDKQIFDHLHPGIYELALETFFPSASFSPEGVQEWRNIREFPIRIKTARSGSVSPEPRMTTNRAMIHPELSAPGIPLQLIDINKKTILLYNVKLHTGSIRATGFDFITGRDAETAKWYSIPFDDISSISFRIEEADHFSGLERPLIAEIIKKNDKKVILVACKCCTISGFREDGRRVGYLLSQIEKIMKVD